MGRVKVTHIITSLLMGGAEKVLLRLLQCMDKEVFDNEVISLTTIGPLADLFEQAGIPVTVIGLNKKNGQISSLAKLAKTLRTSNPDIIQTWLYHGDFIGGTVGRLVTRAPVLWNLRQSNLSPQHSTKSTIKIAKACSVLSYLVPRTIVCGSHAAEHCHVDLGYCRRKMHLLENGFDTDLHQPLAGAAEAFRREHEISDDTVLIGHAGRFDPQKDHPTLLAAAKQVCDQVGNVKLVLCGPDIDWRNDDLRAFVEQQKLESNVILLGDVAEMPAFYSAMDLLVISSAYGEGAPNVLGEAMSCSTPCITTDVGDSAHMIGDTGSVVRPSDPAALAEAIVDFLRLSPEEKVERGVMARRRIIDHFPLAKMVASYEELYKEINASQNRSKV